VKTVIRQAQPFAGVILALVVLAFLDRIPDDPGVFKERCVQQVQSVGISDPACFDTASAIFVARAVPSRNICVRLSLFDAESTIASAGIFDLRSAADSSPPASAS
jgi:hypothetical protein